MTSEADLKHYTLPNEQPICVLEVQTAFDNLTPKQKLYAHYVSKASWNGGLITLLQTSPESAPIFVFLHKLFSTVNPDDFKVLALKSNFSEDEVKALFVYTCGVFANAGNYKGFGDSKFVPNIDQNRLEELLKISSNWNELQPLWKEIKDNIYDLKPGKTCLGFHPTGCTTYLSKNCTAKDNEKVQNWLKTQNMECYNTRLFKTERDSNVTYEIRCASEKRGEITRATQDDITFQITLGDYSPLMGRVAKDLESAKEYAACDNQRSMLQSYAASFKTGSLDDHKTGSEYWIRDKGPVVESYIGFIETYRDPAGVRGEFEGFVAVVNKEMSAKFSTLVSKAEQLLNLLPWNKDFEKDVFLKPDFTSLDVLTFAGSGIPAGINLPNYDDIRQNKGFKNVSLGNVILASYKLSQTPFLGKDDAALLQKWCVSAFEMQVGLHELLGHGSGKLLCKNTDNTFNFPDTLLDPFTDKPPASYYEPGDTYDTRFGALSSSYEECRAEAVGLYLSLDYDVLKIFGHEGEEADEVMYVNWLSLVWTGAGRGLEWWEPGRGWLQAHAQARFVLAQVLIQAGVASVTKVNDNDLLVTLDRTGLRGIGKTAIGQFLLQLQVYKSTGDIENARKLYDQYSDVSEPWLSWRSIVLANKQPRKMFVQSNTKLDNGEVKLKTYEATCEGLIRSWVERFDNPQPLYDELLELTQANAKYF